MMTLDEAIKHCEEVAGENEEIYEAHCRIYSKEVVEKYPSPPCKKCAEEHEQLSKWLKELKQLREQGFVLDKIRAEIEQVKSIMKEEIINNNRKDLINFVNGLNQSLVIVDKYKAEKFCLNNTMSTQNKN